MSIQTIKDTIKNTILPQGTKIKRAKHLEANDAIIDGLYSELYYSDWGVPKPYLSNTLPTDGVYVWCNVQNQTKTEAECHPKFWNIMKSMTIYGGDGVTTVGIPYIDGGRSLVQTGIIDYNGNLVTINVGSIGGTPMVKLTHEQSGVAAHSHNVSKKASDNSGDAHDTLWIVNSDTYNNHLIFTDSANPANAEEPHTNMSPYFAVNYILRIK